MNNGWICEQSNFHSQKKKLMIMKVLHDNFLMRKKLLRFRERVQKFISSWTLHPSIIIVLCHCTLCRLGLWFATFFGFYRNTQMLLFKCYKSYKTGRNIELSNFFRILNLLYLLLFLSAICNQYFKINARPCLVVCCKEKAVNRNPIGFNFFLQLLYVESL